MAFNAYISAGLRRRVVGVTDRRLIVVRSRYFSLSDKGFNPRERFVGPTGSAEANIKKLFTLIPERV